MDRQHATFIRKESSALQQITSRRNTAFTANTPACKNLKGCLLSLGQKEFEYTFLAACGRKQYFFLQPWPSLRCKSYGRFEPNKTMYQVSRSLTNTQILLRRRKYRLLCQLQRKQRQNFIFHLKIRRLFRKKYFLHGCLVFLEKYYTRQSAGKLKLCNLLYTQNSSVLGHRCICKCHVDFSLKLSTT